jgi:hypothetical protein
MTINYKTWKHQLIKFGETIKDSKVNFEKNPSVGDSSDYINGIISFENDKGTICINQSVVRCNDEAEPLYLTLKYCYKNRNDFYLYIYKQGFFDRIFSSGGIKTGNIEFDKEFAIKSNDEKLALRLFKSKTIQEVFLSNPLMTFNILTENNMTEIKLRLMQRKLYSLTEMRTALDNFCRILDQIR